MNSAVYVEDQIQVMKKSGIPLSEVAWKTALACVGWPYVFGDRGQYCTPANRRAAYNRTAEGKDKENIKKKCSNFDGASSCSGCKWFPNGERVREFDCRGFTYWVLYAVYGWKLMGTGCTKQWENEANWKAKGRVLDGIPKDTLVCLFYSKDNKEKTWEHTGFAFNGETVECSNGVQYSASINGKWTHWAIPACEEGDVPEPDPDYRPTLRRGDKGEYVTLMQTKLALRGYDLGSYGIDGSFGRATENVVKQFQKDWGLTQDGVCGKETWAILNSTVPATLKTVHIPHLTLAKAEELQKEYVGAWITEDNNA